MAAKKKYVHVTTSCGWNESYHDSALGDDVDEFFPDPEPPQGDGWELVNGSATQHRIFWFWRKETS